MPQAEPHAGDTRRDPRLLIVLAVLLLALRAGVTVWEDRQAPAGLEGGALAPPDSASGFHMGFSSSGVRRVP